MPAELTPTETSERLDDEDFTLVDIRDPEAYAEGHVPGAENLTLDELEAIVEEREWNDTVAFLCYIGKSSQQAARFVEEYGDAGEVYSVAGGMDEWDGDLEVADDVDALDAGSD
ncbi:rhodanese-related sulfurtransferase [Halarchaeum rubridurum]|uniref:Rhodanese-related sulfurtransferase n=1 Tax=Halarchaeum rubridurum TaxID=489911 RepID=A0A830G3F4_9EURY|nr:rhodanese-like domain-containing protein [Halarchaeum rubridurum]MBP1955569.1 rhodanese-related sulfurtransferase [Halarchaeum rubridurum]GGM73424.1 thiosulfate sulfurtransferase GlpE [Halarchaeum rubridurum]